MIFFVNIFLLKGIRVIKGSDFKYLKQLWIVDDFISFESEIHGLLLYEKKNH